MSREIPFDKPLTRADREYLENRGQYAMVQRLDQNYPQNDPNEQPVVTSGNANVDLLVRENALLQARLAELEVALSATSQNAVDDGDEKGDAGEGDEAPPYATWKKDDLAAEAEARGLSKSGSKDELVKRLEDFDAAQ